MPQNGVHALIGTAARKWMPQQEWLVLGVVLGNMAPDLDNLVVAYATLARLPDPESYHRTFSHSLFTIAAAGYRFRFWEKGEDIYRPHTGPVWHSYE